MKSLTRTEALPSIRKAWKRYVAARRLEGAAGGREHLEEIQAIVDMVGERFVLKIPQPDGIPARLEFLPARLRGVQILTPPGSGESVPIIGA